MQQLTLQTLSDRALISDQLYRYAKGLDTRDWNLVTSVLTDPFHLHAEMLGIDRSLSPREYIEMAPGKFLPGFDATAHLNTNQLITVHGDQAQIETRMYACHYINPQDNTLTDHLSAPASTHCNMQMHWEGWLNRQPNGSWLFHKFYMGVVASEGDMSAMQTARSRVEN